MKKIEVILNEDAGLTSSDRWAIWCDGVFYMYASDLYSLSDCVLKCVSMEAVINHLKSDPQYLVNKPKWD